MNKTNIEWADYTWNPVTGCKNSCSYCYAKRIHSRFNKTAFENIIFHENRLSQPLSVKKPSTIFVGSMSDISFWGQADILSILEVCELCPQHTFMFLSKSPLSYHNAFNWPSNTMQGLTFDLRNYKYLNEKRLERDFLMRCERPFISFEPLLGKIEPSYGKSVKTLMGSKIEKVIVGAQTGPNAVVPKTEWIQSIKYCFPEELIIWKDNIRKFL